MIIDTDALATGKGCADALGVTPSAMGYYRKLRTFPQPVTIITGGSPVWVLSDVVAWARQHGYGRPGPDA